MKELNSPTETANQLHRSVLQLIRLLRTDRPGKTDLSWSKLSVLGRLHRQGQATATDLAAYLRVQPQSPDPSVGRPGKKRPDNPATEPGGPAPEYA